MGNGFAEGCVWLQLPDSLLLRIFQYLERIELGQASIVCAQWHRVSRDEWLWTRLLLNDFSLPTDERDEHGVSAFELWRRRTVVALSRSAYSEYKRLVWSTPQILVQQLCEHTDEVLHVAFAKDGTLFATTSKDGSVKVGEKRVTLFKLFNVETAEVEKCELEGVECDTSVLACVLGRHA